MLERAGGGIGEVLTVKARGGVGVLFAPGDRGETEKSVLNVLAPKQQVVIGACVIELLGSQESDRAAKPGLLVGGAGTQGCIQDADGIVIPAGFQ